MDLIKHTEISAPKEHFKTFKANFEVRGMHGVIFTGGSLWFFYTRAILKA